jgi:hypothetical protein
MVDTDEILREAGDELALGQIHNSPTHDDYINVTRVSYELKPGTVKFECRCDDCNAHFDRCIELLESVGR